MAVATASGKLTAHSLEERVYDAIRGSIISGEFRPGDPLVEAQLSEHFGVSKTPVREALIRLRRDGLVEAALHRVNRVATPTAEDIRQAYEVRIWLECALAARCAEDPTPELRRELEKSVKDAETALAEGDQVGYGEAIRRFSDVIVGAAHNQFASDALERLRNVLALIAHISREVPGRQGRSVKEHRAICRAIKSGNPDAAAAATRAHLESIERDSLEALALHAAEAGTE